MHRSLTLARRGLQQWRDAIKAATYCLTGRVATEALRSSGTKPVGFGDQLRVVHLRAPPTGPSPQARRRIKTPGDEPAPVSRKPPSISTPPSDQVLGQGLGSANGAHLAALGDVTGIQAEADAAFLP